MRLTDVYSAEAIAVVNETAASNKQAYLGEGLFPRKKKTGLDLKWIKTSKGLPVSLMPSAFDTKSTIRSRGGIDVVNTKMAYFKESMLVKEEDEQQIMQVQEASSPFAQEVLDRIYDDANTLIEGADVVAERMRFQLLATDGGHPSISIAADGATYAYNYDPDGSYAANNYKEYKGQSDWSDTVNSDPLADVIEAQGKVEEKTGTKPTNLIVSTKTMALIKKNKNIAGYILALNSTANIIVTEARVKELFKSEADVNIIVYSKKFKDENGVPGQFYPDGFATLVPDGELGNTWFGMTPDERTLLGDANYNCKVVNTGVAVTVTVTSDPVHTKTTVSEIVLPSFERMDETFTMKVVETVSE